LAHRGGRAQDGGKDQKEKTDRGGNRRGHEANPMRAFPPSRHPQFALTDGEKGHELWAITRLWIG